MTEDLAHIEKNDNRDSGLSWPRIAGFSFAIALHAAALLLLLAPLLMVAWLWGLVMKTPVDAFHSATGLAPDTNEKLAS